MWIIKHYYQRKAWPSIFRPRPPTRIRILPVLCDETEIFFLQWPAVHTFPMKTATENPCFLKRCPEWRFLKTLASRLRVGGRKRKFSNMMMSYVIILLPALRMLCEGCYGISIVSAFFGGRTKKYPIRYVWTWIFSDTVEKNLRFQKYPVTCGRVLSLGLRNKMFVCRNYFKNLLDLKFSNQKTTQTVVI